MPAREPQRRLSLRAGIKPHANPFQLAGRLSTHPPRRDRERTCGAVQQLTGALADTHLPLDSVPVRADDEQVPVLMVDDTLQRSADRQVGLNANPCVRREPVTRVARGLLRLFLQPFPIHPLGKDDERIGVDRDEQQFRAGCPGDHLTERDRIVALREPVYAGCDSRNGRTAMMGARLLASGRGS